MHQKIERPMLLAMTIAGISILLNLYITAIETKPDFHTGYNLIRPMLFIALYIIWGFSFKRRILQKQTRRYLISTCILSVLLIVIRCFKYYFAYHWEIERQLWYWYYVPLILIPLMIFFTAITLDQPEDFTMPNQTIFACFPASALILLILTNDLHQMVFSAADFHDTVSRAIYTHEWGYFAALIWIILCLTAAYSIMIVKCHKRQRRIWLPLIPYLVLLIFLGCQFLGFWSKFLFYDFILLFTFLLIFAQECCIQVGLIASNTDYDTLFAAGTFAAQIFDQNGELYVRSSNARPIDPKTMVLDSDDAFLYDRHTIIRKNEIRGGSVYWQEDISEIVKILDRLQENRQSLAEKLLIEEESYRIKKQIEALKAQNRTYDLLRSENNAAIRRLTVLIDAAKQAKDPMLQHHILHEILLTGVYLKRRGNLILLGEKQSLIELEELALSLKEICSGLELTGTVWGIKLPEELRFHSRELIALLDFVYGCLAGKCSDLTDVYLSGHISGQDFELRLMLMSKSNQNTPECSGPENDPLQYQTKIALPEVLHA